MEQTLANAEEGACGFSTGLNVFTGASAPASELERLCHVVAGHGKIYATHMRDYGDHLTCPDRGRSAMDPTGCRVDAANDQQIPSSLGHG